MSIEVPEFPARFDWWNVRSTLTDWFFRFQRSQSLVPAGTIVEFGGSTPPDGWLECDGATYNQDKYPDLYGAIGTFYGGGVGTFDVPPTTATTIGQIWIIKV